MQTEATVAAVASAGNCTAVTPAAARVLRVSLSCCSDAPDSEPQTLLMALLDGMLTRLEARPSLFAEFNAAIHRLAALAHTFPGSALTHWSLCSGIGFSSLAIRTILPWVSKRCKTAAIGVRECVAAEKEKKKRLLYMAQHSPEVMTDNMACLTESKVFNDAQDGHGKSSLPWCFFLDAGIPCVSRSGNSCNQEKMQTASKTS